MTTGTTSPAVAAEGLDPHAVGRRDEKVREHEHERAGREIAPPARRGNVIGLLGDCRRAPRTAFVSPSRSATSQTRFAAPRGAASTGPTRLRDRATRRRFVAAARARRDRRRRLDERSGVSRAREETRGRRRMPGRAGRSRATTRGAFVCRSGRVRRTRRVPSQAESVAAVANQSIVETGVARFVRARADHPRRPAPRRRLGQVAEGETDGRAVAAARAGRSAAPWSGTVVSRRSGDAAVPNPVPPADRRGRGAAEPARGSGP